ncbi:MAG: hypothetical protein HQL53_01785 [Magnetococcales bacterium]|nr:hypothetical protein [Magnetococcales bacterium]
MNAKSLLQNLTMLVALLTPLTWGTPLSAQPINRLSSTQRAIEVEIRFMELLFERAGFFPDFRAAKRQLTPKPTDTAIVDEFWNDTIRNWQEKAKSFTAAQLTQMEFSKHKSPANAAQFKRLAFPAYRSCATTRLYGLYGLFGKPFAEIFQNQFFEKQTSLLDAILQQENYVTKHSEDEPGLNHALTFGIDYNHCLEQVAEHFKKELQAMPDQVTQQY